MNGYVFPYNEGVIATCHSSLYQLKCNDIIKRSGISVLFLALFHINNLCYADERIYRYDMDISHDDYVCQHMLEVYNTKFIEPWNQQKFPQPNFADYFPRLPGVDYNYKLQLNTIYSKYPTSPEFEAIKWREGRTWLQGGEWLRGHKPEDITLYPMLVAEFDIDNDGVTETVFKNSFMYEFAVEGLDNPYSADDDHLEIYPEGGFVFNGIPELGEIAHGQPNGPAPRFLEARQLRPFILNGVTYLSKYEPFWSAKKLDKFTPRGHLLPIKEYLYIVKYKGGGQFIKFGKYTKEEMESVCRLRMIPQQH